MEKGRAGAGLAEAEAEAVAWPKPRWRGQNNWQWQACDRTQPSDSRAPEDLRGVLLAKVGETSQTAASLSPPYYSGSPPPRASNPLVRDASFHKQELELPRRRNPVPQPAALRIESFECLNRNGSNRGIASTA